MTALKAQRGRLSAAIKLAKEHEAELHTISVEELPRFPASVDEVIEEKAEANHVYEAVMSRAMAQAQAPGVKLTPHVVVGHPVSTISDFVASGTASTCSWWAIWAIPRFTTASSAAQRTASSSMPRPPFSWSNEAAFD